MTKPATSHDWLDAMACETCEGEIDFPDEYVELGVCRHCGIAFLVDVAVSRRAGGRRTIQA